MDVGAPGFTPYPWQNPLLPVDVNNDGLVVPLDVLLLINDINTGGTRSLPLVPSGANRVPPYLDASGDNFLAPADVLLVINYINTHLVASSEGEAVALATLSSGLEGWPSYDAAPAAYLPNVPPVQRADTVSNAAYPWSATYQSLVPTRPADGETQLPSVGTSSNERDLPGHATRTAPPGDLDRDLAQWEAILSDIAEDVLRGRQQGARNR